MSFANCHPIRSPEGKGVGFETTGDLLIGSHDVEGFTDSQGYF